jgi:uncharacterized protein (TIGR03382 family)
MLARLKGMLHPRRSLVLLVVFLAGVTTASATWHLPGESTMQIVNLPGGQQSVQVTYVPEPTTIATAAGALALSAMVRRRRARRVVQ